MKERGRKMNIEKLIEYIKIRPCMYIGELNFDYLFHFINGFLYNNFSNKKNDDIDIIFKNEFHEWVQKWIEKNKNIYFDEERDYHFYIQKISQTQQQCFDLFFRLCDLFFHELHNRMR